MSFAVFTHDQLKRDINGMRGDLVRFINSKVRNHDQSEDIASMTIISAYMHREQFKGGNLKNWMLRIAINHIANYKRRNPVHISTEEENHAVVLRDKPFEQCDIARVDDLDWVRAKVSGLSETQREIFYLYFEEQLTFTQIGEVQGRPMQTVRADYHRALKRIRDSIPNLNRVEKYKHIPEEKAQDIIRRYQNKETMRSIADDESLGISYYMIQWTLKRRGII